MASEESSKNTETVPEENVQPDGAVSQESAGNPEPVPDEASGKARKQKKSLRSGKTDGRDCDHGFFRDL